jgi:hypothetical protein
MLYLFNALVLPIDFDNYPSVTLKVSKITLEEARQILSQGFTSAVGHEATASRLSFLLGFSVPTNRIAILMKPGDKGLHFVLKRRLPEGTILGHQDMVGLEFWFVKSEVV